MLAILRCCAVQRGAEYSVGRMDDFSARRCCCRGARWVSSVAV